MDIRNKTGKPLPDFLEEDMREICWKARIAPAGVTLILRNRNKSRWSRVAAPSGCYQVDGRTIIVRIPPKMAREDFRFVLAHEIGHLKAHLLAKPIERLRRLTRNDYGEHKANNFALNICHCYPKCKFYRGVRREGK